MRIPGFIFDREALHLLLMTKDSSDRCRSFSFLGPLRVQVCSSLLPAFPRDTINWGDSGRVNRHMIPRNQSREPNSRDSAYQQKGEPINEELRAGLLVRGAIFLLLFYGYMDSTNLAWQKWRGKEKVMQAIGQDCLLLLLPQSVASWKMLYDSWKTTD